MSCSVVLTHYRCICTISDVPVIWTLDYVNAVCFSDHCVLAKAQKYFRRIYSWIQIHVRWICKAQCNCKCAEYIARLGYSVSYFEKPPGCAESILIPSVFILLPGYIHGLQGVVKIFEQVLHTNWLLCRGLAISYRDVILVFLIKAFSSSTSCAETVKVELTG